MGSQIPGEPNFNKYIQYCNMKTLEENSKDRMRGKKKKKNPSEISILNSLNKIILRVKFSYKIGFNFKLQHLYHYSTFLEILQVWSYGGYKKKI